MGHRSMTNTSSYSMYDYLHITIIRCHKHEHRSQPTLLKHSYIHENDDHVEILEKQVVVTIDR